MLCRELLQAFTKPALVQCRDPNLETVDARIVDRPLALVAVPSVAQAQVQVQIDPSIIRQIQRIPTAPPSVVALGDSAISGEAGRWAGNTNQSSSKTDALGSTAYNDIPGAESTPGCHRSKSAEVHIGDGVQSANISCSGARTYSRMSDGKFKPGIDFYNVGGRQGPGAPAPGVRAPTRTSRPSWC